MSFLANVVNSQDIQRGICCVIAGVEGVGKTTFAASAPNALLMPLETGYSGVSVPAMQQFEYFEHVMLAMDEIIASIQAGTFPYDSLIVDTTTALERLIHTAVLMKDPNWGAENAKAVTMESALGGFGKAYTFANELFAKFLAKCDVIASYNKNIVLTCHSFAATVQDPINGEYQTWDIQLHAPKNQKTYGKREMVTQWADLIGFIHEPFILVKDAGEKTLLGVSTRQGRKMAVVRTPSYIAKNRYNVTKVIDLPVGQNGWNNLAQAIYDASGRNFFNYEAIPQEAATE